ncbi:hypothetical protein HanXRQr2_Chr16g0754961 [Helianthus annuus]|uniref:Uncharacterized protein n=1 Tax=Helianthus annuus TaxID=4232 RepID=A0A251S076_HELAN|nr:hypothetical protein HanXRQr2_Chr16g0754961 [Helianthus annuus]KAJ0443406.1 hypothetical protein HanIR_Chr16g0820391 [Helianthus annuus]KAJ0821729.1 hypothetical protein HanPSC8_Chr16g0723651 [Helianthus annuus]
MLFTTRINIKWLIIHNNILRRLLSTVSRGTLGISFPQVPAIVVETERGCQML